MGGLFELRERFWDYSEMRDSEGLAGKDEIEGSPWINNHKEQAIGRMKMRARTARGYNTRSDLLNGLLVSSTALC